MNTDKKSTFVPQSNQSSAEQEKAPIFHVQTGLRAGAGDIGGEGVRDPYYGNDAARGYNAAKSSANFLANWFN